MAEANQNTASAEEQPIITPEAQMQAFQGFSTKDGEVTVQTGPQAQEEAPADGAKPTSPDGQQLEAQDEGDEAQDDGGEGGKAQDDGGEDGDKQQPSKAKTNDPQVRINQAIKRQRTAEREVESVRTQNAQLTQQLADMSSRMERLEKGLTAEPEKRKIDPDAPKAEDYEFGALDENFAADTSRYYAEKAVQDSQATAQQQQTTREQDALRQEWEGKRDDFASRGAEKFDDFQEVVIEGADRNEYPVSAVLAQAVMTEDFGPEIAYQLATNLPEAERVSKLSTTAQLSWFARQQIKLEGTAGKPGDGQQHPSQSQQQMPGVPAPLPGGSRGGRPNGGATADTNDFAAFEALANGQRG